MMSSPGLPAPSSGIEVTVEDVHALATAIAEGTLRLVDCRESDEWDINHLPGAELVPLSNFMVAAESLIAERKSTIVYCHHGIRSMQAVEWLRSRGLANCWSMRGGIDAWSDRIDSTVPKY
jgi:rhodanese-related sulfurtransferase